MRRLDMHIHTKASDGVLTPKEAVEWAYRIGLTGIAITDHDTVDGIEEAQKTAMNLEGFEFIPGIEFSTLLSDEEVHILGYHIDYKNKELVELTRRIKEERWHRGKKMIELLNKYNYAITLEEVLQHAGDGVIGRPHIARVLLNKGYVHTLQNAFEKLLGKGKPAYVERFKLSPQDAILIIKKSGGIPVLAHPGLQSRKVNIMDLIDQGIAGIEVYHTKHTPLENRMYLEVAQRYDLIVTGGSDYHDAYIDGIPAIGSVTVNYLNKK
ncbi:MAG: PHP domain-containing protein [Thermotaleaceae bacterium]